MNRQRANYRKKYAPGTYTGLITTLVSLFALLLVSCTADQQLGEVSMRAKSDAAQVESVGAIDFNGTEITASVISTGCTLLDHFTVEHEIRGDTCHVTLVRTKADFCRRAPFLVEVAIPWEPPAQCEQLTLAFDNPIMDADPNTFKRSVGRQQTPEQ